MRSIIFILIALFLFHNVPVFSQTKEIEYLRSLLSKTEKEDSIKVNVLNELSFSLYTSFELDSCLLYAQGALSLAKKIAYKKGEGFAFVNVASYYADLDILNSYEANRKIAKKYMDSAYAIAIGVGDNKLTGFVNHAYAALDWYKGNYQAALDKYNKALQFYREAGEKKLTAFVMRALGMIYVGQTNYAEALRCTFAALKYFEEVKDDLKIAESYNIAGDVYTYENSYSEAIKSYSSGLEIFKKNNKEWDVAHQFANIADVYLSLKDFKNAMLNYNEAIPALLKTGTSQLWLLAWVLLGVGKCYELKGDSAAITGDMTVAKGNYELAQNYYISSLRKNDSLNNKEDMIQAYVYLADVNTKLPDYLRAEKYLQQAMQLCKTVNLKNLYRDTYLGFSGLYEKTGNSKKAFESYKNYILYKDSIINEESIRKSEGYKMQYESEKKEDQIKLLTTENKLQTTIASKESQRKNFAYSGIAIIALLGGYGFYRYRRKKKLQSRQAVMNERLRISRELHDEVGATLSGIAMYSHLAKEQIKTNQGVEIEKSLNIMQQSSGEMVNKLNDIVWLINPEQDSLKKLIERLEEYAINMGAIKKMQVRVKVPEKIASIELPIENRRNIYLFCKEAINNAVKYSNGSLLELIIKETDGKLEFSVSDNGKGFDAVMVRRGNGLENMQKRADEIGAKLLLESKTNEGAKISMQCKVG